MADIIIDLYTESKKYQKLLFQKGRDVPSDEINELQDILRVNKRRTERELWGDGFFNLGFQVTQSSNPNEILISEGASLIQGEYYRNDSQFAISGLTTPSGSDRQDIVYLRAREIEITSIDDPDIEFPAIGETARRVKLVVDVLVGEGTTVVPTTTGDLHDGGIHYQPIAILNRVDGDPTITTVMMEDIRRIIGIVFLNEDKNLQTVEGGNISWEVLGANKVSWDEDIRIVQPSTNGHAIIPFSAYPSGFDLISDGDVAFVNLNRNASGDYNVALQLGTWYSIPSNSNAYPLFYRINNKLYATDGTAWGSGQTHKLRQNPITGQIFDADVATNADIQGSKLLDNSVPNSKLIGPFPDSLTSGNIVMREDGPACPSGYTKVSYGSANDTFIQIAAAGSAGNTTPAGSNNHDHGAHAHNSGSYYTPILIFDFGINNLCYGCGGFGAVWDAFPASVQSGGSYVNFGVGGTSGSTTLSSVDHRPKRVQLILCKKT